MQGLFVRPEGAKYPHRPKSKKEVAALVKSGELGRVHIEATSLFGNEWSGTLDQAPSHETFTCVGPDPYTDRRFYLTIARNAKGAWTVK